MAEKLTRKDLKGPDEFMTSLGRAVEWTKGNLRTVILAAAGVTAAAAIVFGATGYRSWQERSATANLWPHINRVREFMSSSEAGDKEKLLRLDQALQANMGEAPRSLASVYARYYLGSLAFSRGEYDLAAARFREALSIRKGEGTLFLLLHLGVAQSLEGKGDFPGAVSAYRDAAAVGGGELALEAKMGEARCLLASGKKEDAVSIYRGILTAQPPPGIKERVELSLSRLS